MPSASQTPDPRVPTVSVIVPSWRRPGDLARCLAALRAQTIAPHEVIVGVRTGDEQTHGVVADAARGAPFPVRVATTAEAGVIAAMNAALGSCTGDVIALTDDDAEPRADWIMRLGAAFEDHMVGAAGGRDWQPKERGDRGDVGRVQWFGRVIGNHHLGAGPARDVDVLKGVNMAVRADLLSDLRFDQRLRGLGAQMFWEIALCLPLRRAGWRIVYDPAIAVDHHVAERHDDDQRHRGVFAAQPQVAAVHNETLILLEHLGVTRRTAFLAWAVLAGTQIEPGILQLPRLLLRGDWSAPRKFLATMRGRAAGFVHWLRSAPPELPLPPTGQPAHRGARLGALPIAARPRPHVVIVMPLGTALGGGEEMLRQFLVQSQDIDARSALTIVFLRDGPFVDEARRLGHDCHVIDAGRFRNPVARLAAVFRIAHLAWSVDADLVFGWMVAGQAMAGPAALVAGVPNAWYQVGTPRPDWLDRFATVWPTRGVVALSRDGKDAQERVWPRRPVRLVYPGVPLGRLARIAEELPGAVRARLGLPTGVPLVGIVGRLQRWKGIHVFIEAIAEVRRTNPTLRGVIVGGPHETEPAYPTELREMAERLGVADAITFAGFQPNALEWMQAMDVVVHASDHEPFGIVVVEAMALGKPVVAGSGGGPAEIISPGVDGLLVAYGETSELARAISRLLHAPSEAARLGNAARTRAAAFSEREYAARLLAAMQEFARS